MNQTLHTTRGDSDIGAPPELIRLMHDLAFISGGPGFVVPIGLLIAGIAVPGLLARLLPRPLAWAGLIIAALVVLFVSSSGVQVQAVGSAR